jgi:hypothetical protein
MHIRKFLAAFPLVLIAIVVLFLLIKRPAVAPGATPTPSTSASASATPAKEQNITITSPSAGDTVSNPITVTGKARVFENTFAFRLTDTKGKKLYENHAMSDAKDAGLFGNYTVKIPVPVGAPKDLIVEVFEYSAKDGSIINLARVPVVLETQETMKVKAFFNNVKLDPEVTCTTSFPVEREVIKTQEVAYIALTELLKGVTNAERPPGYGTSIPPNVQINSLVIRYGTAYVDFDGTLQQDVGGSCRVGSIRSQIENTLKQFSSVKKVVISIDGRTDNILQP